MESGVSGLAPPREWDVVTTATCRAEGDECVYVCAGRAIPERGTAEAAACFERALEGLLDPPYRAVARRRHGDLWAVGAVRIQVCELPPELAGDELTLVVDETGSRALTIDGRPAVAGIDALERLVAGRFQAYVLRATCLDAATWEFTVEPL